MRIAVPLLVVVVAGACEPDPAPRPFDAAPTADAPVAPVPTCAPVAGSRIRTIRVVGGDVREAAGLHDVETGDCVLGELAGAVRCVPDVQPTRIVGALDPACTQRLTVPDRFPPTHVAAIAGAVPAAVTYYRATSVTLPPGTIAYDPDHGCAPITLSGTYQRLGTELPPEALVRFVATSAPDAAPIQAVSYVGDDGSRTCAVDRLVHEGQACTPALFGSRVRCAPSPTPADWIRDDLFVDERCAMPGALAQITAAPDPRVVWLVEEVRRVEAPIAIAYQRLATGECLPLALVHAFQLGPPLPTDGFPAAEVETLASGGRLAPRVLRFTGGASVATYTYDDSTLGVTCRFRSRPDGIYCEPGQETAIDPAPISAVSGYADPACTTPVVVSRLDRPRDATVDFRPVLGPRTAPLFLLRSDGSCAQAVDGPYVDLGAPLAHSDMVAGHVEFD